MCVSVSNISWSSSRAKSNIFLTFSHWNNKRSSSLVNETEFHHSAGLCSFYFMFNLLSSVSRFAETSVCPNQTYMRYRICPPIDTPALQHVFLNITWLRRTQEQEVHSDWTLNVQVTITGNDKINSKIVSTPPVFFILHSALSPKSNSVFSVLRINEECKTLKNKNK